MSTFLLKVITEIPVQLIVTLIIYLIKLIINILKRKNDR